MDDLLKQMKTDYLKKLQWLSLASSFTETDFQVPVAAFVHIIRRNKQPLSCLSYSQHSPSIAKVMTSI